MGMAYVISGRRFVVTVGCLVLFITNFWLGVKAAQVSDSVPQLLVTQADVTHAIQGAERKLHNAWKKCTDKYDSALADDDVKVIVEYLEQAVSYFQRLQKFYSEEQYKQPREGSLSVRVASSNLTTPQLQMYRLYLKNVCFGPILKRIQVLKGLYLIQLTLESPQVIGRRLFELMRFWQEVPVALQSWDGRLTEFFNVLDETRRWWDLYHPKEPTDDLVLSEELVNRYRELVTAFNHIRMLLSDKEEEYYKAEIDTLCGDLRKLGDVIVGDKPSILTAPYEYIWGDDCASVLAGLVQGIQKLNTAITDKQQRVPDDWQDVDEEWREYLQGLNTQRFADKYEMPMIGNMILQVKDLIGVELQPQGISTLHIPSSDTVQNMMMQGSEQIKRTKLGSWIQRKIGLDKLMQTVNGYVELFTRAPSAMKGLVQQNKHLVRRVSEQVLPYVDLKQEMNNHIQQSLRAQERSTLAEASTPSLSRQKTLRSLALKDIQSVTDTIDRLQGSLCVALQDMSGLEKERKGEADEYDPVNWVAVPRTILEEGGARELSVLDSIESNENIYSALYDSKVKEIGTDIYKASHLWFESEQQRFLTLLTGQEIGNNRRRALYGSMGAVGFSAYIMYHIRKKTWQKHSGWIVMASAFAVTSLYTASRSIRWLQNHSYIDVARCAIEPKILAAPEADHHVVEGQWQRYMRYWYPDSRQLAWCDSLNTVAKRAPSDWCNRQLNTRDTVTASIMEAIRKKDPINQNPCVIPVVRLQHMPSPL